MEKRCEQTLLARGVVSEVVFCSHCRVFHVNVDALTVHFEAAALRDLHDTLSAARCLRAHAAGEGSGACRVAPAGEVDALTPGTAYQGPGTFYETTSKGGHMSKQTYTRIVQMRRSSALSVRPDIRQSLCTGIRPSAGEARRPARFRLRDSGRHRESALRAARAHVREMPRDPRRGVPRMRPAIHRRAPARLQRACGKRPTCMQTRARSGASFRYQIRKRRLPLCAGTAAWRPAALTGTYQA